MTNSNYFLFPKKTGVGEVPLRILLSVDWARGLKGSKLFVCGF